MLFCHRILKLQGTLQKSNFSFLKRYFLSCFLFCFSTIITAAVVNLKVSTIPNIGFFQNRINLLDKEEDFLFFYQLFKLSHHVDLSYQIATESILKYPKNIVWHEKRAEAADILGNTMVAREEYQWLFHHNPNNVEYLSNMLATFKKTKNLHVILEAVSQILAAESLNKEKIYSLVNALYQKGEITSAWIVLTAWKNIATYPPNIDFWVSYAKLSKLEGQHEALLDAWRILLQNKVLAEKTILELIKLEEILGMSAFAYQDAKQAWEQTHQLNFLVIAFQKGQTVGAFKEMKQLFETLTDNERALIIKTLGKSVQDELYWLGNAQRIVDYISLFWSHTPYFTRLAHTFWNAETDAVINKKPVLKLSIVIPVPLTNVAKNSLCLDVRCKQKLL